MVFKRLQTLLAALLCFFAVSVAQAADPAPLAAYGALPNVEDAAISPSGDNIALLVTLDGQRVLLFINSEKRIYMRTSVGDAKIREFDWIGDDRLLLVTSQTEDVWGFTTDKIEVSTARIIPTSAGGETDTIFGNNPKLINAINGSYGVRRVNGRWTGFFGAIEMRRGRLNEYTFDHGRPYLYSVDLASNKAVRVERSASENMYRDWVIDANGRVAATFDISMNSGDWTITGPGGKTLASGRQELGRAGLIGLDYEGTSLIYSVRDAENNSRWFTVPLVGGTPQPFLADVAVDQLYFDPVSGYLTGYLDEDEEPVFQNPEHRRAVSMIRKAFKNYRVTLMDWTSDFSKVLVRTSGNADSGTWFVVDLANLKADAIAYERPEIGPNHIGRISTFDFVAQDGLEMDGILSLPAGREAKYLPVVILPHGGPTSQDREEFDWWAQAFASRGYAVFQPNFRGSTNRGDSFRQAGYGEWGRKMQTDLSDGLAALAEKGIVDPTRACIVGASYGGYAALAGVTVQQDVYRCAVAVAPVSDLRDMYNEDYRASGRRKLTKASLLDQLGPSDRWNDVSPRRLASRADAPVMLIHGKDDTVVPYSHSHRMADALKDANKPYELVALDGEDHWLSKSETRLKMLSAAMSFMLKHNPPN